VGEAPTNGVSDDARKVPENIHGVAAGELDVRGKTQVFTDQHTVADNGLKALQILQEKAYDLILMDIRMPEMDGIEASHHIRNREEFSIDKNVPIIVVTAHDDADERKKCYELGINEYLTKPIDKDLLLQKIKEQILARSPLK
jgi:CheY-like chemotaxis protein